MTESTTLEKHFKKKGGKQYFVELKESLEKLENKISPLFVEQFNKYRNELLSLVAENVSTADDPFVQSFIADKNRRIGVALSLSPEIPYKSFIPEYPYE
jgi:hypothetical protein